MLKNMLIDICGSDLFSSVYDHVSMNLFSSSGDYSDVLSMISDVSQGTVMTVALMLMLIYFCIALVDKMSSENFTWEQMTRQMCMFFASYFLIIHGFEVLTKLFELGLSFTSEVYNVVGGGDGGSLLLVDNPGMSEEAAAEAMIEELKGDLNLADGAIISIIGDLYMFVLLLLPWIGSWILRICVSIVCYTRIIEIYARAAFAPIAMSDFFHNGFNGAGWRFLKAFFAVCLQGALLVVIGMVYGSLVTTFVGFDAGSGTHAFTFFGKILAAGCATAMLMFKSQSICKELLGVN